MEAIYGCEYKYKVNRLDKILYNSESLVMIGEFIHPMGGKVECIVLELTVVGDSARIGITDSKSIQDLKYGLWNELDIDTRNVEELKICRTSYPDHDDVKVYIREKEYIHLTSKMETGFELYNPVERLYVNVFKPVLKISYVKEVQ